MSLFGFKSSIDKSVNMENDKIIYLDFLVLLKNASVYFGWWGRIRPQIRVEARTEKESWRPSFMLFLIPVDEPTNRKVVLCWFSYCAKRLNHWSLDLCPKTAFFHQSTRRSYVIHIFHISHHTTQKLEKKHTKKWCGKFHKSSVRKRSLPILGWGSGGCA